MKKIKIGVFGAGHLGKIHIRLIKEIEDFELIGFYDVDDEVARIVKDEFAVERFNNAEELIEASDAIDIVAPTIHHFEIAEKAIKKLRHVFVEKPVTTTLEEAEALVQMQREAEVKIQVGHVERFNPAFLALDETQLRPMFIETHRLAEFNPRGTDVSVVLDLMIHDLDIVLHMVKSEVRRISASGVCVVSDTPDIANARIEFGNGCVANLTASRISMKNMRKMRFFQKDAYISVDFLNKHTEIISMTDATDENPLAMQIKTADGKIRNISYQNPIIDKSINAIKLELTRFHESITKNTKPPVSLYDGYNALRVAYQIIEKINDSGSKLM
jgi:predicted dehydrogenase